MEGSDHKYPPFPPSRRREISALQAENYSLERQLFSYQKSIAFASSRGTYSDELVSPDSHAHFPDTAEGAGRNGVEHAPTGYAERCFDDGDYNA